MVRAGPLNPSRPLIMVGPLNPSRPIVLVWSLLVLGVRVEYQSESEDVDGEGLVQVCVAKETLALLSNTFNEVDDSVIPVTAH